VKGERLGKGKGKKYHHPQLTLWTLTAIALQPVSCLFYYSSSRCNVQTHLR